MTENGGIRTSKELGVGQNLEGDVGVIAVASEDLHSVHAQFCALCRKYRTNYQFDNYGAKIMIPVFESLSDA